MLEPLVSCLTASWSVKFKAELSFTAGWGGRSAHQVQENGGSQAFLGGSESLGSFKLGESFNYINKSLSFG